MSENDTADANDVAAGEDRSPAAAAAPAVVLTPGQVAARLTVSRRTLERLVAAGEFPAPMKIGRASRFHPGDVAIYLEKLRRRRGDKIGTS